VHLIKFAFLLLLLAIGLPLQAQEHYTHNNKCQPLSEQHEDTHTQNTADKPLRDQYVYTTADQVQRDQDENTNTQNTADQPQQLQHILDSDTTIATSTPLQNKNSVNTTTPSIERRWFFLHAGIGYFATGGDWSQRYPTHLSVPLSVEYSHRSNWSFGADFSFFLGSNVNNQNLYGDMVNDSGLLLDMNGFPAVVRTYQRGFSTRAFVLKNWILHKHRNSRLLLQTGGGVGYYQHYTKFTFDLDQVPQIDGNFQGGYNRHTQGTQLFEQVKIQYINNDAISFSIGIEAGQGYGRRIHPYDFALQKMQTQSIRDTYLGGVISLMIPINFRDRISEVDYYME